MACTGTSLPFPGGGGGGGGGNSSDDDDDGGGGGVSKFRRIFTVFVVPSELY
jgi:hypothetical protein